MALTSNERKRSERLKLVSMVFIIKSLNESNESEKLMELIIGFSLYRLYNRLVEQPMVVVDRPLKINRNIASFTESQCWNFFEFRQSDLYRLLTNLKFSEYCKLENGSVMSGEEILLRGLYELVSGEDHYTISENVFGREFTQQSRAFSYFVDHIYSTFLDIMMDNLEWWYLSGFMENSRRAIEGKLKSLGLTFDEQNKSRVCGFIDCNCLGMQLENNNYYF